MPLAVGRGHGHSVAHSGNGHSGAGAVIPSGVESRGGGVRGGRGVTARDGVAYAGIGPSRRRVTDGLRLLTDGRHERTVTGRGSQPRSVHGATTGGNGKSTFSSCSTGPSSCSARTGISPCGSVTPSAGAAIWPLPYPLAVAWVAGKRVAAWVCPVQAFAAAVQEGPTSPAGKLFHRAKGAIFAADGLGLPGRAASREGHALRVPPSSVRPQEPTAR